VTDKSAPVSHLDPGEELSPPLAIIIAP